MFKLVRTPSVPGVPAGLDFPYGSLRADMNTVNGRRTQLGELEPVNVTFPLSGLQRFQPALRYITYSCCHSSVT